MYKGHSVLLIAPAHNEENKIGHVVRRIPPDLVDKIMVVDDGSTDQTAVLAKEAGAEVLSLGRMCGVGAAIRAGFDYARQNKFDLVVVIAGNNKDDPEELPRLLDPLCGGMSDCTIGSRYLPGGQQRGDVPLYRRWATRLHPWLMGLVCRARLSESTNGFRGLRVAVLDDPRLRLDQPWLDHYELEVYLLIKLYRLGYRVREVPVSKTYPSRHLGYTKMRPVLDWWKMLRPLFLLGLGLRD